MLRISIRELHMKTGDWVRKAAREQGVVVMERGKPMVRIIPFKDEDHGVSFAERPLVDGFSKLPSISHDSVDYISEDRERA